jgi:hypothetical protein
MRTIILIITIAILLSGCTQAEEVLNEKINYRTYTSNSFEIQYPDWPEGEKDSETEIMVSKGYCTVVINTNEADAKQLYNQMVESIKEATHILSYKENEAKLSIETTSTYQTHKIRSDIRLFGCNKKAHIVNIACIEQVMNNSNVQSLYNTIFNSVKCTEENQIIEEEIKNSKTTYSTYKDEDFTVEYPEWSEFGDQSEEQKLAVTAGVCSVVINKHNARPKDLINWLEQSIKSQADHNIIDSYENKNIQYLTYESPYQEYTVTSKAKLVYCNYETYMTVAMCVNELRNEEYAAIQEKVLNSVKCAKEYEIPTPKIIEQKKEIIEEQEPEIIEEIKEEIVKTNAGEEFGLDEEMIVYFINNNQFFKNVLKDFPKGNLIFEDTKRNLELKIEINNKGEITSVEDGQHSNPSITLIMPLRDALNILSNAENINPITIIGFAINVKTEPKHIKNEVIQRVIRGDYS